MQSSQIDFETSKFRPSALPCALIALIACVALVASGCKKPAEIVKHKVPKARSGLDSLRNPMSSSTDMGSMGSMGAMPTSANPTGDPRRMVVGYYATDSATWFFKILGPIEQVDKTAPQWQSFFETLSFKDGEPKYDVPDGWSKGAARAMRFATLVMGENDPPLEMAISSLGPGQDLLLNVNRWRGQLGLESIGNDGLANDAKEVGFENGKAWLIDISEQPKAASPDQPQPPASEFGVKFEAPDGWEKGKTSPMVPVRLLRTIDEEKVQMTIIPMPAAANEWKPNAERWVGQVGLKLSEEETGSRTTTIQVDGIDGNFLTLIDEPDGNGQALVAGMVNKDDTAWFVKLSGKNDVVKQSQEEFKSFLDTIKFPSE